MDQSIEEYKTIRAEILRNFKGDGRESDCLHNGDGVALAYGIKRISTGGRPRILGNSKLEE